MRSVVGAMLAVGVILAAGPSRGGDEQFFVGLIPGEPLTTSELEQYYGKGIEVTFNVGGAGTVTSNADLLINDSSVDQSENINSSSLTSNQGITTVVPVIGNDNYTDITVNIVININTVTIQESLTGSVVTVNQSLDLGGVVQAFGY